VAAAIAAYNLNNAALNPGLMNRPCRPAPRKRPGGARRAGGTRQARAEDLERGHELPRAATGCRPSSLPWRACASPFSRPAAPGLPSARQAGMPAGTGRWRGTVTAAGWRPA
jgi:hypothetical protein